MCLLPEASKESSGTPPALVHTLSLTNIYSSSSLKKSSLLCSQLSLLSHEHSAPNSIFSGSSFLCSLSPRVLPLKKYPQTHNSPCFSSLASFYPFPQPPPWQGGVVVVGTSRPRDFCCCQMDACYQPRKSSGSVNPSSLCEGPFI